MSLTSDSHQCDDNSTTNNGICFHLLFEEIEKMNLSDGESKTMNINGIPYIINSTEELYLIKEAEEKTFQIIKHPYYVTFKPNANTNETFKKLIFSPEQLKKELISMSLLNNGTYKSSKKSSLLPIADNFLLFLLEQNSLICNLQEESEILRNFYESAKNSLQLSISPNFYEIYKESSNIVEFSLLSSPQRTLLKRLLYNFLSGSHETFFLCGSYGIGKSMTLQDFTYHCRNTQPSIYFNIKCLYSFRNNAMKLFDIIKKEAIKLFSNFEDYSNFVLELCKMDYTLPYWEIILKIIKMLLADKGHYLIVIDKYRRKFDSSESYLGKIKALLFLSNIKLVVASSINDDEIRENLINQWIGFPINDSDKYVYFPSLVSAENIQVKDEQLDILLNDYLPMFNYLPKYFYLLIKNRNNIAGFIKNEKDCIYNNLLRFYHEDIGMLVIQTLLIKMNLYHDLTFQEFKNIIRVIPLKYFQIERTNDELSYRITPHFNLIIEVLNDIIYVNLNFLETSTAIFQELIKNQSFQGIFFEELVHYQFKPTLKTFRNFSVEKIVYVDSLLNFKKITPIHVLPKTAYIRPNNAFSPVFDAALLIRSRDESYKIVFFQISINKEKEKLITNEELKVLFFEKRKKNSGNNKTKEYDSIRKCIYKNFHIKIKKDNFYFYYIFRYESEIAKNIEHCEKNNINYILFSMKTKKFYSTQKGIVNQSKLTYLSFDKSRAVHIKNIENSLELLGKKTKRDTGSPAKNK